MRTDPTPCSDRGWGCGAFRAESFGAPHARPPWAYPGFCHHPYQCSAAVPGWCSKSDRGLADAFVAPFLASRQVDEHAFPLAPRPAPARPVDQGHTMGADDLAIVDAFARGAIGRPTLRRAEAPCQHQAGDLERVPRPAPAVLFTGSHVRASLRLQEGCAVGGSE